MKIENIDQIDKHIVLGTPLDIEYYAGRGFGGNRIKKTFVVSRIRVKDFIVPAGFHRRERTLTLFTESNRVRFLAMYDREGDTGKSTWYLNGENDRTVGSNIQVNAHKGFAEIEVIE